MFFAIQKGADSRYTNNIDLDWVTVNTDAGWTHTQVDGTDVIYKGYSLDYKMPELVEIPQMYDSSNGNYTIITVTKTALTIHHNRVRTYPIEYTQTTITNLPQYPGATIVHSDSRVTLHPDYSVTQTPIKLPLTLIDVPGKTFNRGVGYVMSMFKGNMNAYLSQNGVENLTVRDTGGLDCNLIMSYLDACKVQPRHLDQEVWEADDFVVNTRHLLNQQWAYEQLDLFAKPTVVVSGAWGDEYLLRGPETIAMITAWHDVDFIAELEANPKCYHYKHFKKYLGTFEFHYKTRQELQRRCSTREELNRYILDWLCNDYQHWHLNRTLTWTPLHDISYARILLNYTIDELMPQFLDGTITRSLIARFNVDRLNSITAYKNDITPVLE